jgi:hypothetical protein
MFRDRIKGAVRDLGRFCFRLLNIDLFFRISQRTSYLLARLTFFKDWVVMANGWPQYFNHQINLYQWMYRPAGWSFTARGVYARERMFQGCKVLDLCCGDGSYSYLFFSDIAGAIDAVDRDPQALRHARKYYASRPNIRFHRLDAVTDEFPRSDYDFVVWNAAICYFDLPDIHRILRKIADCGSAGMYLYGIAPLATGYADHKTEFRDVAELRGLLMNYFTDVHVQQVDELTIQNVYFRASGPRRAQ